MWKKKMRICFLVFLGRSVPWLVAWYKQNKIKWFSNFFLDQQKKVDLIDGYSFWMANGPRLEFLRLIVGRHFWNYEFIGLHPVTIVLFILLLCQMVATETVNKTLNFQRRGQYYCGYLPLWFCAQFSLKKIINLYINLWVVHSSNFKKIKDV